MKELRKQSGLSLIEALISIVILLGTIMASTRIMNQIQQNRKYSEHLVALAITRNNVIHWLNNRLAWETMVFHNTNLSCLRNNSTDCSGVLAAPPSIDIFAINYDGTATSPGVVYRATDVVPNVNGLTLHGGVGLFGVGQPNRIGCQGYNNLATNVNCPIRMDLNWQPITDQPAAGPMFYPAVLVQGRFLTPVDNQMRIPSLDTLSFDFRVPFSYCKIGDPALGNYAQANFVAPTAVNITYNPALPGVPIRIRNTNPGLNSTDFALVNGLTPCHKVVLSFIDEGAANPPPGPACNVNNPCAKICVGPAANPCQYEYRKYFSGGVGGLTTFSLFQKNTAASPAVLVYTKPNAVPFTGVEVSKFQVNKGIVQFLYNGSVVQTFTVGIRDNFEFRFYPGAKTGVNGEFSGLQFEYKL